MSILACDNISFLRNRARTMAARSSSAALPPPLRSLQPFLDAPSDPIAEALISEKRAVDRSDAIALRHFTIPLRIPAHTPKAGSARGEASEQFGPQFGTQFVSQVVQS